MKKIDENLDAKLANIIKESAAIFFERIANNTSLVTVTSCFVTDRGKHAVVGVTVLPEKMESSAISFLKRNMGEFRDYLKKHSRIGIVPYVEVEIDKGEKNRQKIDKLLLE